MRILLSGSHGLIGRALCSFLEAKGHHVVHLTRQKSTDQESVVWDPTKGILDKNQFEDFDAVIHLAGENIASKRWTHKQKQKIFLSRCRDTWLLSQVLTRLYRPPLTVITASAVGIYGDRGDEVLTESSKSGCGFLANLCQEWENSTQAIENRGSRVVHTRFGAVLSPDGGMLKRVLPAFRLGLGGKLGSGEQFISWIDLEDAVRALYHVLVNPTIQGAVNVVSPFPIRQAEFARLLAHQVHRPAFLNMPAGILRLILGEMADEVLLSSERAVPQLLLDAGFNFHAPHIESSFSKLSRA